MAAIGTFLGASGAAAAGVGTMATLGTAGLAASVYGANKNAKAIASATDKNIAAAKEADALAYQRWLESRGQGANGEAVNAKLPRWATVNVRVPGAGAMRLVKKGSMPAQSFGITGPAYASMNRSVPTGAGGGGGGGAFFGDGPKTDFISRNNWFDDGQSTDPMFIASYA